MKKLSILIFYPLFVACLTLLTLSTSAQNCSPSYSGSLCEGSVMCFFANAPGYDDFGWEWDHDGLTSTDRDPKHAFPKAGTYIVKFTAKDKGGLLPDCSKSITIVIKESPRALITLISKKEQCFEGNQFCFADSSKSASGSSIVRVSYLFSDGTLYEFINPSFPRTVCHTILDKRGGYFDLIVELEDKNGCITKVTYQDIIRVRSYLGIVVNSNAPIHCDSGTATITNQSFINWLKDPTTTIDLKDIDSFSWDFGDGTTISGDSITNTEWWTGKALDGKIKHTYYESGTFDITLTVKSSNDCQESFTFKSGATVKKFNPVIIADRDSTCTNQPEVRFRLKDGPIQGTSAFQWNFGDPASGPSNIDYQSWFPSHNYSGGVWMVSLRIIAGPCDIMVFDTISKFGPTSTIETVGNRILEKERYQCTIRDSVHFTNSSTFYRSYDEGLDPFLFDWVITDSSLLVADSTINICYDSSWQAPGDSLVGTKAKSRFYLDSTIVCGQPKFKGKSEPQIEKWRLGSFVDLGVGQVYYTKYLVRSKKICKDTTYKSGTYLPTKRKKEYRFNFDPSRRFGDQTAIKNPLSIPTNNNIVRLWSLGDRFAPQCTTDTKNNVNVGVNCNFSRDSLPVHWYTPWETIYKKYNGSEFYTEGVPRTVFSKYARKCSRIMVYPADSMFVQREIRVIAPKGQKHRFTVNFIDSVSGTPGIDTFNLDANTVQAGPLQKNNYSIQIHRPNKVIFGPIKHIAELMDQEFMIPLGVEIEVENLTTGTSVTHTGPKNVIVQLHHQYKVAKGDSIISVFDTSEIAQKLIVAQPSTYVRDKIIKGIDSFETITETVVDPGYHRTFFYKYRATCNQVSLYQKDTSHPFQCESSTQSTLALLPPNASGLTWESGSPCAVAGGEPFNQNKSLVFSLHKTKPGCTQQWFEINYDTFLGSNNWRNYKSGQVLAPPAPGSPIPFVLPYQRIGAWGNKIVKSYSVGEVDQEKRKDQNGEFTLGLIIGNGPPQFDKSCQAIAPECTDTAWYGKMFRVKYMNPAFDLITESNRTEMCKGEAAYVKLKEVNQTDIKRLAISWIIYDGRNTLSKFYVEQRGYFDDYSGPSPTRNDSDVNWNGETSWKYDYVIRSKPFYEVDNGRIVHRNKVDTLVTRIYRKYVVKAVTIDRRQIITGGTYPGDIDIFDIPKEELHYYLGSPSNPSCIDTTGIGQYFEFEYGGVTQNTVRHGRYYYEYTDDKSDSSIVDEIVLENGQLLLGPDSFITSYTLTTKDGTKYSKGDTIDGLYKIDYTYPRLIEDPNNPNLQIIDFVDATGVGTTSVFLENTDGCQSTNSVHTTHGFFHSEKLIPEAVAINDVVRLNDSIRYWMLDDFNQYYPTNSTIFWEDPARYQIVETKSVDWDLDDGKEDFERAVVFTHIYEKPGSYTIRLAMKDSNQCKDTAIIVARVSDIEADFRAIRSGIYCDGTFDFYDSTRVIDPCSTNASGQKCDSIIRYEWDFGDGSWFSSLKNPRHQYSTPGWYRVSLTVWSALGAKDTVSKQIYFAGPKPRFEFVRQSPSWPENEATICMGSKIQLRNTTDTSVINPQWIINWGDGVTGAFTRIDGVATHTYKKAGTYQVSLDMEDELKGTSVKCLTTFPDTSSTGGKNAKTMTVVVLRGVSIDVSDSNLAVKELATLKAVYGREYNRHSWHYGDGDTLMQFYPDTLVRHAYQSSGTYNLKLIPRLRPGGKPSVCHAEPQVTMRVGTHGISDQIKLPVTLYPNPAKNTLYIAGEKRNMVHLAIQIFDMNGKMVLEKGIGSLNSSVNAIDLSSIKAGAYVFLLKDKEEEYSGKFIKE